MVERSPHTALPVGQNIFIRARGYYATGGNNGSGSLVESVRNAYLIGQAPEIISQDSTTFTVGEEGEFTILTTGFPTPAVTLDGELPDSVIFSDNGDGTAALAGTPEAGTGGVYPLIITASNGMPPDAIQYFTLTVLEEAPAIISEDNTTFTAGVEGEFTILTTGFPTPAVTLDGELPDGVIFSDNGDGTATLAGTPEAGTGGVYPLIITASNGAPPDAVQNFTLTVLEEAPAIISQDSTTFVVGEEGEFTIMTTGFPAPAITLDGEFPDGVIFSDNGDGTAALAGIPEAGTGGVYPLTITATNGVPPDAFQNFTLTVLEEEAPEVHLRIYLPLLLVQ